MWVCCVCGVLCTMLCVVVSCVVVCLSIFFYTTSNIDVLSKKKATKNHSKPTYPFKNKFTTKKHLTTNAFKGHSDNIVNYYTKTYTHNTSQGSLYQVNQNRQDKVPVKRFHYDTSPIISLGVFYTVKTIFVVC